MEVNVQTAIRKSGDIQRKLATQSQGGNDKLGKQDFLNLFMTQLSNQDPLDPMDSSKMMQQVSQMGNMEQLQLMNQKMDAFNSSQKEMLQYQALGYLNQDVSYAESKINLAEGKAGSYSYFVPEDAKTIKINVFSPTEGIIAQKSLDDIKLGEYEFKWDGKNSKGELVKDGEYNVSFMATNSKGEKIEIDQNRISRVTKIKFVDGRPQLLVNGEYRDATEVKLIGSKPNFAGAEPLLAEYPQNIQTMGNQEGLAEKIAQNTNVAQTQMSGAKPEAPSAVKPKAVN